MTAPTETTASILDGSLVVRRILHQQLRKTTDAPTHAALSAAIADQFWAADTVADYLAESGTGNTAAPGFLSGLLTWLLANWSKILTAILALFGITPPTPA